MKELLEKPGFMTSAGTMGADVSYLLAVVFTVLFLIAWGMAKKAQGTRHHKLILISMVSMVVYFCGYYYARQLGVLAFEGKEGFGGPQSIYDNVFVPVLTTHLVLVTLGLVLAFYMVSQGFRASEKVDGEYLLKSGDMKVSAKAFNKIMLTIIGLAMLSLVFNMLIRQASMGNTIAWALIFATIALVVSLEKGIEKMIPDGARRHRIIGRGTMIVYALTLVTSTTVFLMLYVFYPAK